jgi:YidC/Oxa1 family membrane protein insertase
MGFMAGPLSFLLSFLYEFIQNYGITILAFTLIVKLLLYPLHAKQVKSSVKMSELQPKMKELQKKYASDKQELNMKMMDLYKKEKFNPASGCLPALIQMPIIFGLFALLRNPMRYIEGDEMIIATHESFLWLMDLSQPDPWILPVLAGITTFISFTQTQAQQGNSLDANPMMGSMMRMMKYFLPLMILVMGRTFPAGLTIYWFFGQAVQIVFNLHLNRVRKKLKAELEKKNRNKK